MKLKNKLSSFLEYFLSENQMNRKVPDHDMARYEFLQFQQRTYMEMGTLMQINVPHWHSYKTVENDYNVTLHHGQ